MLRLLFDLMAPGGTRAPLSVLIFHRVHEVPDPLFPAEPDSGSFDRQLGWLKSWFTVLALEEAVAGLRRGTLPPRPAVLTFDDGYADNHRVALPILRRHELTATFFIATGFIDGGRMWNDTVIESVRRWPRPVLDLSRLSLGTFSITSDAERRAAIDALIGRLKYLPAEARGRLAQDIAAQADVPLPDDLMMSSAQVRALAAAGMTVGAHTVNHPILARVSEAEARAEIRDSKSDLERMINREVKFFAYPNGKPGSDYGAAHVRLVREAGFVAALSTAWGAAKPGCDPYQIPRFTPWAQTPAGYGLRLAHNLKRGAYAQA